MEIEAQFDLARLTTTEFSELLAADLPVVVLLPVGSVEPHGPHLALSTDTAISIAACQKAARRLTKIAIPLIAPSLPYGVTECAKAFKGAISISSETLTAFLCDVIAGFLSNDVSHVCLVNNHLEPDHYLALKNAIDSDGSVSLACPLAKRWARTLSEEFKRGECHAGRYETSIILAADKTLVKEEIAANLAEVPISLSEKLQAGVDDFVEMGLTESYSGAPAAASIEEGEEMLNRLAEMIVSEVCESINIELK